MAFVWSRTCPWLCCVVRVESLVFVERQEYETETAHFSYNEHVALSIISSQFLLMTRPKDNVGLIIPMLNLLFLERI